MNVAKPEILSFFSGASQRIYSSQQLAQILQEKRQAWNLAQATTFSEFIDFLRKQGDLKRHEFRSEHYDRKITRYSYGTANFYDLVLSLKSRGYLCHATALHINGLTKANQKTTYLNVEQSAKTLRDSSLTQEGIDRAFAGKQRQSNLIYKYRSSSVIMIAGKSTNNLGVEEIVTPLSNVVRATNLERTLIDVVVRPAYAGGIPLVLKAYRTAKNRISVDRLIVTLQTLGYVYPYHQAIGFLMKQAGYPKQDLEKLRALGLSYNFYLTHGLKQPKFSEDWRIFYPSDLVGG